MILARDPPVMRQGAHHEIPCVQIFRRLALRPEVLGGIELRLDAEDDPLGDLVLHGEYVVQRAIVLFGPDMAAAHDVVELRRYADAVAALAHAALDHITHAELL